MFDFDPNCEIDWEDHYMNVLMIEVVEGIHTPAADGLYLHSAGLIAWIERDIRSYVREGLEDEAATLEDFLRRLRLLIASRGPQRI